MILTLLYHAVNSWAYLILQRYSLFLAMWSLRHQTARNFLHKLEVLGWRVSKNSPLAITFVTSYGNWKIKCVKQCVILCVLFVYLKVISLIDYLPIHESRCPPFIPLWLSMTVYRKQKLSICFCVWLIYSIFSPDLEVCIYNSYIYFFLKWFWESFLMLELN